MLTKEQALELVSEKLRRMSPKDDLFVVADQSTIAKPYGWVFFYNSKTFLEEGVNSYRLAGNGPVIVNKHTRSIEFFGTNKPPEELMRDYERKLTGGNAV
jgi:hypothetical protein